VSAAAARRCAGRWGPGRVVASHRHYDSWRRRGDGGGCARHPAPAASAL